MSDQAPPWLNNLAAALGVPDHALNWTQALQTVTELRYALETIARLGAPGATDCRLRSDDHSCDLCGGRQTPCPVMVAKRALKRAGVER